MNNLNTLKTYGLKITRKLIKEGKIKNECNLCGSKSNIELHHKKYTLNPKDWQLLCMPCHKKEHHKLRNGKRKNPKSVYGETQNIMLPPKLIKKIDSLKEYSSEPRWHVIKTIIQEYKKYEAQIK